ncbi:hypothetical protein [Thiomicrorhabdus sp.]|uniref:hypothetical protein n=1 Tax=Thiomicrorhabdus sp. TaxID=2039724 RepID=UPI003567217A
MKMNLAVVMQTIDKATAPLKKIKGEYGQFTPKVEAAQKALKDNSGLLSNVQALKKLQAQHKANNDAINVAKEKLEKYQAQIRSGRPLSAQQQAQYNKTRTKLYELNQVQSDYRAQLSKTGKALKKAGVDTKHLTSEEKRLIGAHEKSITTLNKLQNRYKKIESIKAKLAKPFTFGGVKAGAVGLLGTGASIAGFFTQLNSSAGTMDSLSKAAQNLKMPIGELQAMQSQAEHNGVSADTMEGNLRRFTKRLGVLQTTGSGALGSFLKKGKNPLYYQLQQAKTTDEAYQQLLESFSKLKTNQEQMAFADAAFGQDGRKMLIMLREGTKGLTAARKEFNDLGGGIKEDDAKAAEAYNDAMQRIQEASRSIKYASLAPIMRELTVIFSDFTEKFKNADWREGTIKQVRETLKGFFDVIKSIGRGILFLVNYFPEVVAGILMLKTAFFTLNAVMYANPIGMIVGALSALAIGLTYAYLKSKTFREVVGGLWEFLKRFGFGVGAIFGELVRLFLLLPRAIMKMVSLIPDSLLPEGWGKSIKKGQKDLEAFNTRFKELNKSGMQYAINGNSDIMMNVAAAGTPGQAITGQNRSIIKSPTVQSRSSVDIRVRSDKPVDIAQVQADTGTDLSVNTGDLFADGI